MAHDSLYGARPVGIDIHSATFISEISFTIFHDNLKTR